MFVFVVSCVLILHCSHIECEDLELKYNMVFYDIKDKKWKRTTPSSSTKGAMLYDLGKMARMKVVAVVWSKTESDGTSVNVFSITLPNSSIQECTLRYGHYGCPISRWINVTGEHTTISVIGMYLHHENFIGCYKANLKSLGSPGIAKDFTRCFTECINRNSYYSSLENENNCYCLNTLSGLQHVDPEKCQLCQTGDMYCGTEGILPIYAPYMKFHLRNDSDIPCYDDLNTCHSGCAGGKFGFNCEFRNCDDSNGGCGTNMICVKYEIKGLLNGYCLCKSGFYLDNIYSCQDEDECKDPYVCNFMKNSICNNVVGSYSCVCPDGYQKTGDSICEDIDECLRSICDKDTTICVNEIGSYKCECKKGFTDKIPPLMHGCVDVDECQVGSRCKSESTICRNTLGSYDCDCKHGYQRKDDFSCKDIDECTLSICDFMTTTCKNKQGSYSCPCKEGFANINSTKDRCIDVDECLERNMCERSSTDCINTVGKYFCRCKSGYLHKSASACEDIDECSLSICDILTTDCKNEPGSYSCPCRGGFANINSTKDRCVDVDECLGRTLCDHGSTTCKNTFGDYDCDCRNGYQYQTWYSCIDIDECALNQCNELTSLCKNEIGSYDCICKTGFLKEATSSKVCFDINECGEVNRCDIDTTICGNIPGSYVCECKTGYLRNSSSKCADKNECLEMQHKCGEKSICRNTIGSYECGCPDGTKTFVYGYLVDCQDVDECEGSNDCDVAKSVCINMVPSYFCQCFSGYVNVDNFTCKKGLVTRSSTTIDDDDKYEDGDGEFENYELTTATVPGDDSQSNFLMQHQNTIIGLTVIFVFILVVLRWFINMRKINIESAASTMTGNLSVKSATVSTVDI